MSVLHIPVVENSRSEVIQLLERHIENIKSGEFEPDFACLIMTDTRPESFEQKVAYQGRLTEILGLNEVAKITLLQDTGVV